MSTSTSPLHDVRGLRLVLAVGLLLGAVAAVPVDVARAEEPAAPRAVTIDTAAYDDLMATRLAALPDGGAVIAGRRIGAGSNPPLVIERIDAAGATVWRHEHADLPGQTQHALTLVADADRIIVGGTVRRRSDDGFVRILGHDGTVRSTTFFASSDHQFDGVHSLALLPEGAIVVVGRTAGELVVPRISPTRTDGFVALVEPDGSVAWTRQRARRWGETGPVPTSFEQVLVAPDGRILVVADVRCNREAWCAGMEPELAFLVLDRAGTLAAVTRVRSADLFPGAHLTGFNVGQVLPGPDGPIVTGYQGGSRDSLRVSGLGWDLTPAWAGPSVLGTSRGLFSGGPAAVLSDGRIVVAPTASYGAEFDGANHGGPDGLVAVLSARGEVLDVRQYGGAADERANGLAVLADGRVLVTGVAGQGLSEYGLTPTARPIGTRLGVSLAQPAVAHVHVPGTPAPAPASTVSNDAEWGDPAAVAPAVPAPAPPAAPVTVDGANGLLSLVSSIRGTERGGGVAALPASDVTVTAGWTGGTPSVLSVTRREADGSVAWTRTFDTVVQNTNTTAPLVTTATVAGQPRIVVTTAGRTGATHRGHVVVLDADGTQRWSRTLPDSVGVGVVLAGVHLADDGTVIGVGSSRVEVSGGGTATRPLAVRYGPDGTLAWAVSSERDGPGMFRGVAVAPDGTLVVSEHDIRSCSVAEPCTPRADVHLVRIAPEDGARIARVTHDLGDLFGAAVRYRVDGSPYAYVTGFHGGPEGPVLTGLVMRSSEYCLVTAGIGWDLARAWAGPAVHCSDGAELELWSAMTVLADGRIVTGSSSYSETAVAGPSLGHVDVVLGVHDARGVLLDAVQYGGSFQDVPSGIVATANGHIIVATSSGSGVTSLGAATSVTAVGEHTRVTLVSGVPTWRSGVALRAQGGDGGAGSAGGVAARSSELEVAVEPEVAVAPEPEPVDGPPSAPLDVTVGLDRDRLAVGWTPPTDDGGSRVTRHHVEVVDAATGTVVATRSLTVSQRTPFFTNIRDRDVDVRVAATNVHGTGEWSAPARMAMRAPSPATVTHIEEIASGRLRVHLAPAGDGTPDATRIHVRVLDGDGPRARVVGSNTSCRGTSLAACTVPVRPTSIPADGRLWVDVRGNSPLGWGGYGARVPVTVSTPTPEAVTRITARAMSGGRIDVRWSRAPLAGGVPHVRQVVEVRRGSGPDAPLIRTCSVTGTLSRCLVSGAPSRVDLSITVRTDNLFGEGASSAPVSVRLR